MFSSLVEKGRSSERKFTTLNASRWAFGFQVFRANISKILIMNMILLFFALPTVALAIYRLARLNYAVSIAPFSANMGIGYMPYTKLVGIEGQIEYAANAFFFRLFPLAMAFFGIGLSGILEVNKKLLWLEDVNVFRDFLKGLSKNWFVIILSFIVGVLISAGFMIMSYANLSSSFVGNGWLGQFTKIVCGIAIVLFIIMFLNMSVMHTTYKVTFFGLIKNCFLISAILIPLHLFFVAFSLIPVVFFFFDGMFKAIGLILTVVFGLEFILFVWTDYSHWVYEKFLPRPVNKTAKTRSQEEINAEREAKRAIRKDRNLDDDILPVKPVNEGLAVGSVPMIYSFNDLVKLNELREQMRLDSDKFKTSIEQMQNGKSEVKSETAKAETQNNSEKPKNKENNTNNRKHKKGRK